MSGQTYRGHKFRLRYARKIGNHWLCADELACSRAILHPEFPRQTVACPSLPPSILSNVQPAAAGLPPVWMWPASARRTPQDKMLGPGSNLEAPSVATLSTRRRLGSGQMRHAARDGAWRERWHVAGAGLMGVWALSPLGCGSFPLRCGLSPLVDLFGASVARPPSDVARPSSVWPGVLLPPLCCGSPSLRCSSSPPPLQLVPPSAVALSPRLLLFPPRHGSCPPRRGLKSPWPH